MRYFFVFMCGVFVGISIVIIGSVLWTKRLMNEMGLNLFDITNQDKVERARESYIRRRRASNQTIDVEWEE